MREAFFYAALEPWSINDLMLEPVMKVSKTNVQEITSWINFIKFWNYLEVFQYMNGAHTDEQLTFCWFSM
jgi:hypothetical protein